jgi:general secretion pathway protein D
LIIMMRIHRMAHRPGALAATIFAALLLLAACSSADEKALRLEREGEWLKAVLEYRRLLAAEPDDPEIKLHLASAELKAANLASERGVDLLREGRFDEAIAQFQQGLVAQPKHARLQEGLRLALARLAAGRSYEEGVRLYEAGRPEEARRAFGRALEEYPDHEPARRALAAIDERARLEREGRFALTSRAPITLNFRQTPLQTAFEFLARSFGVNIIFDEGVDNAPVTLFARHVTFEQSLHLLLTSSRTFYKQIGPNTLLIAQDTADKRAQYEDLIVRSFQLNSIGSKNMLDILKGVIAPKKVIVNEELNTLIVRDTRPVIEQVQRLIQLNDRVPAEVLVEVEILEVSRSKALQLGLDLGSQVTRSFTAAASFKEAVANDTITLPAITFRYFKQDVDAKTLANPKIRVLNAKLAKIHIGDRVPLRSSTIQDATGQTRTTFVYTDIGIRLGVEPAIHLDDSVTIKLGLEVSSLGQNLGTAAEPAFAIGTRNAETAMRLRNGETVILGGLIRDEERRTQVKVPGLGDIPAVGSVFTSYDNSDTNTEVLLTITPHVMRSWDLPARAGLEFFSGTGNVYADRPLFSYLNAEQGPTGDRLPDIRTGSGDALPPPARAAPAPGSARPGGPRPAAGAPPRLDFAQPLYETTQGEPLVVRLTGEQLGAGGVVETELLFNAAVLEYVRASAVAPAVAAVEAAPGAQPGSLRLRVALHPDARVAEATPLAEITLRGHAKGISYLAYRAPRLSGTGPAAEPETPVQVGASRVVVR